MGSTSIKVGREINERKNRKGSSQKKQEKEMLILEQTEGGTPERR